MLIGNRDWMLKNRVHIYPEVESLMADQEEKGHTVVLCAMNGMCFFIFLKLIKYCHSFAFFLLQGFPKIADWYNHCC